MKKNNTIIIVIGIIALFGVLFYLTFRNKSSVPVNTVSDPHNHNLAANVSSSLLNDLIGKQTPAFSLTDRDGKIYSSDSLKGKNVVLFFNEGLMCYPACWNQIVALSQDERFKNEDTVVLSVVVDPQQDWQEAVKKMPELAQAAVVFDSGASVSKKFSVLSTPSSMHPGLFPGHTYIVIDKEGVVRYVFDDPNMGIRNDQMVTEISKLSP